MLHVVAAAACQRSLSTTAPLAVGVPPSSMALAFTRRHRACRGGAGSSLWAAPYVAAGRVGGPGAFGGQQQRRWISSEEKALMFRTKGDELMQSLGESPDGGEEAQPEVLNEAIKSYRMSLAAADVPDTHYNLACAHMRRMKDRTHGCRAVDHLTQVGFTFLAPAVRSPLIYPFAEFSLSLCCSLCFTTSFATSPPIISALRWIHGIRTRRRT